jgi:large conductance mechanosensitive channel
MRVKEDAMSMVKEFKEFALKGNVIDLAIAVVIGAAFAKIITSFVDDILTPALGVLFGKHDLSSYFVTLSPGHFETLAQAKAAGAATLNYGIFLNTVINFLIVAAAIFLAVHKLIKMMQKPTEKTTPDLRDCPQCLSPIPKKAVRCKFCSQPVPPVATPSALPA